MNIFRNFYLKTNKYKLYKPFKPLGLKRKEKFLVSTPVKIKDFLKMLPFLGGLRKLGEVVLLAPQSFVPFLKIFKAKIFQGIYWSKVPEVLTREFDFLKRELENYNCNWLIELNPDANLALPGLINVERRVAFYNTKNFPYYNILIKGGIDSLSDFFQIPAVAPGTLFKFNKIELKNISKNLPVERPLLFVNTDEKKPFVKPESLKWTGTIVLINKAAEDIELLCKKLYLCDAYYGPDDEFCEMARIFKKEIITL